MLMLASFFVTRPVFAWVMALLLTFIGGVSLFNLPIEQYPDIAPPTVNVTATYSGASADVVESSVTQVIEQQLKGIDHLLYFSASSSVDGRSSLTLTFDKTADPDIAQLQVQNAVNQAINRLPEDVQRQGVTVTKGRGDSLLVIALYDETGQASAFDIADYLATHVLDPLSRVNGVGETTLFGSQYAMRIWLDPVRLKAYGLMPSDIREAVVSQNAQVAAGEIGGLPTSDSQYLNTTVTMTSRLQTPEQFENIVLRTNSDGSRLRLKDVARVELGAESYANQSSLNGYPASGISVQLASGANALDTANAVKRLIGELEASLPEGYQFAFPRDSTPFIDASINNVLQTLIEAIALVVVVIFVFLQNLRATVVPAIIIPVVLFATFLVFDLVGLSINTLTLFAIVLAIGLLVDDAIVVVENVERERNQQGLPPGEATLVSMRDISGALIGTSLVLVAVFVPMSLTSGSVGTIYQQFSLTMMAAMVISTFLALTLTPSLCAQLLRHSGRESRFFQALTGA
tara:strand:+ start:310 stop:1860 length:1551 start_codon:yes stop_codon:yes gene_type:complete